MYLGHLATGLAARRLSTPVPLVVLLIATVAVDLGDVALGIAGHASTGAYTHTLPAVLVWSAVAGVLASAAYGGRGGLVVGALVALHLPLDYVTSTLDLWPHGPQLGLALYGARWVDLAIESALLAIGVALYRTTLPPGTRASVSTAAMVVVLVALQVVFDVWIVV